MRAFDIVDRLAANLPKYTAGFSESVGIISITLVGTTATVTTSASHGLANGQNAAILGVKAPVQINAATFARVGTVATFETLQDHDLTLSERDIANGGQTITISGAVEPEFNGTFPLIRVHNRRKLSISVADSGSTTISGAPIVQAAGRNVFNGLFPVANVTASTFDYTLPEAYPLNPVVTGAAVQTGIRIAAVLDIRQYLLDVYTKQLVGDDTLIVQLGDVTASKKRNEETDAGASANSAQSYAPMVIQQFGLYIIMNATAELSAADLRDKVESEYIPAIFRSVLRAPFASGFSYNSHRATFTGHGVYGYFDELGKNKAVYVHEVTFEQLCQLTQADMVGADDSVAMRNVGYTLTVDPGTGVDTLTADVNLDEEPLP